jgi:hypothetical protein
VLQQSQAPKVLALELVYQPAAELGAAAPLLQELAQQLVDAVGPPAAGGGPGQAGT